MPNPARFPTGCKFHPRCPRTRALAANAHAADTTTIRSGDEIFTILSRCKNEEPTLREVVPSHGAACHQIATYDKAPSMISHIEHQRTVVPLAVIDGDPEKIVKEEVAQ